MPTSRNSRLAATSSPLAEPLGIRRGITVALIAVVGLCLRLFCLNCKPFWFDEAFSVEVARVTWLNFLHLLWWREGNMSLYYLLLRPWLHIGQNPFFIRSLSALIAAATIPVIYWLGSLLYDRRAALIATALFAFNAYHIRYAQEARSYALFALLGTLSSGFLVAFLKRPTPTNRRAYLLSSILSIYAHFYALLLIVAQWLALRWIAPAGPDSEEPGTVEESWLRNAREMRKSWRIIAAGAIPVLVFVAKTGAGPIKWIKRPGAADLLRFAEDMTNGWPVVYLAGGGFALLAVGSHLLKRPRTWNEWRVQFLSIWTLFPIVLTVMLSFARPVFLPRYMIFCIPALVILTAAGIASIRPVWVSGILAGALLLLSAASVPSVYSHDFDNERDGSIAASEFILDHSLPADAVVFHIAETRIPYEYMRSLRSGQNTTSPGFEAHFGPEIVFPNHGSGLDYRDFTGKPSPEFLRHELPLYSNVWVMLMNNGTQEKPDPTTVLLSQVLPQMFPHMQTWQFPKVELRLYSKQ
jgi:mannosyltransferase